MLKLSVPYLRLQNVQSKSLTIFKRRESTSGYWAEVAPDLNVCIFFFFLNFCFPVKYKTGKFNLVKHTSQIPNQNNKKTLPAFCQFRTYLLILPQPPCYARHLSFVLVDLYFSWVLYS